MNAVRNKRLKKLVEERDHGICAVCGIYDAKWESDHIHEIWASGPDDIDNLQTLCRRHHQDKTAEQTGRRAKADRLAARHQQTRQRKPVRAST
jgi:5-methylcytosine-specific restriction endonuclease McrA